MRALAEAVRARAKRSPRPEEVEDLRAQALAEVQARGDEAIKKARQLQELLAQFAELLGSDDEQP